MATVGGAVANTQKNVKIMLNPDVDGYTEILNHWKIHRKSIENNNVLKIKKILKPKYQLSGSRFLHLVYQGGFALLPPLVTLLIGGPTLRLLRMSGGWMGPDPSSFTLGDLKPTPIPLVISPSTVVFRSDWTCNLIHALVKQTQFCLSFIALWSQNGSFQTLQSC